VWLVLCVLLIILFTTKILSASVRNQPHSYRTVRPSRNFSFASNSVLDIHTRAKEVKKDAFLIFSDGHEARVLVNPGTWSESLYQLQGLPSPSCKAVYITFIHHKGRQQIQKENKDNIYNKYSA